MLLARIVILVHRRLMVFTDVSDAGLHQGRTPRAVGQISYWWHSLSSVSSLYQCLFILFGVILPGSDTGTGRCGSLDNGVGRSGLRGLL